MSVLSGAISWFGGPNDPSAQGLTASGAPTSTPGIAINNRSTLGGYWMVRLPNDHAFITKQTDIGPAPSTGRSIDFTYSLLPLLGYTQQNFPTNGQAKAVYLGKTLSDVANNYSKATGDLNVSTDVGAIDTSYLKPLASKGVQGLNFDMLTPAGVNPQSYAHGVTSAGDAALTAVQELQHIWGSLTNPTFWVRILKFLAGAVLIYMGLKALTGVEGPSPSVRVGPAKVKL